MERDDHPGVPRRATRAVRARERISAVSLESWVSLIVVAVSVAFTAAQLQPQLLVSDTTPAGGDMGAHVWGPAYLRDVLLPSGQVTGWTQDWYAGFPAYHFYMVLPSLLIVALDVVLPYGVAFKLVSVSGVVSMPACAWAFGRLARLPFPAPLLLAVATTAFLFDRSFSIYGGNIASTLAGEFAFSMSLALALVYLGVVARGLETGRHRGWAALLLALVGLCHLIPAFFAVAGTLVWFAIWALRDASATRRASALAPWLALVIAVLAWVGFGARWPPTLVALVVVGAPTATFVGLWVRDVLGERRPDPRAELLPAATRARARWLVTVAPVGAMLAAFWVLPFYAKQRYLNDMGWVKEETFMNFLFFRDDLVGGGLKDVPQLAWVLALAAVGLVVSVAFRHRAGIWLAVMAVLAAAAFVGVPQGRLWNTRLLPFYYLSLYLLAAVGVAQLHQLLARVRLRRAVAAVTAVLVVALQGALVLAPSEIRLPVPPRWAWTGIAIDDRFVPYLLVGIALLAAVGAAELVAVSPAARRRATLLAGAGALLAQLAMAVRPVLRTDDRLLGWFAALVVLAVLGAFLEVLRAPAARRRALTRAALAGALVVWVLLLVGPASWRAASGLLVWFSASLVLLTAIALLELRAWLRPASPAPGDRSLARLAQVALVGAAAAVVLVSLALPMRPWPGREVAGAYRLGPLHTTDQSFIDGWAAWNYRGYEAECAPGQREGECGRGAKPYFPEYEAIVDTMARVGEEHGCGRAMWEYGKDLDAYGTPMALMLLPHWTDGCIGSMEGLYFEASTTTPFHFLNQDKLSAAGSNAQRGLPYVAGTPSAADFDLGISHLQMLGVRYYLAFSPEMIGYARAHPDLTEIATSPQRCREGLCPEDLEEDPDRWVVFEVADSELVVALEATPVVLTGVGAEHTCESVPFEEDPRGRRCEGWLEPAVEWYQDPSLWSVPLAEDGPGEWERVAVEDWLVGRTLASDPLPAVEVTDVVMGHQSISFRVSEPGTPVLVKASYFPNWEARGAEGPYRVTPNLMVVIPTQEEVVLSYGLVPVDLLAFALTVAGLVLLVALFRRPDPLVSPEPEVRSEPEGEA